MPKGIVIKQSTGMVLYKFDIPTLPTLRRDEEIILREDINDILVGAIYNKDTATYTNPEKPVTIPVEIDANNENEKIFRGCGTFFFPPRWIGESIEFPKVILANDWEKLEPLFEKHREIIYKTEYQDLSILVCRDGFIGICGIEHKSKGDYFNLDWQRRFLEMLQVMTAIGFLLNKEMLIVRSNDIFQFIKEIDDTNLFQIGMGRSVSYGSSRDSLFFQRFGSSSGRFFFGLSPPRTLIDISEIDTIIETAKIYFGRAEFQDDLITFLEAYTHFYYDEFNQSFTLSWVIIEAWINEKLKDLIDSSEMPPIKNIKKLHSVFDKSSYLFKAGYIKDDDFETVDKLRQIRNDYLHDRKSIEKEDAFKCFELIKKIIKCELDL
ncbi:MAG: DUF4145 domain-containing protein [Spirochaetes bacterium]|nr:DUF4145 domain-containing protein [Spirochaetota bacterium]